ncbi:LOW QUALITY PROTEIN: arginyl-tRNA synthetase, partial [Streptomyces pristinaespiralis ATCC 25486]
RTQPPLPCALRSRPRPRPLPQRRAARVRRQPGRACRRARSHRRRRRSSGRARGRRPPRCARPARPASGSHRRRSPLLPEQRSAQRAARRGRETLGRPPFAAGPCRGRRDGARRWPVPARYQRARPSV